MDERKGRKKTNTGKWEEEKVSQRKRGNGKQAKTGKEVEVNIHRRNLEWKRRCREKFIHNNKKKKDGWIAT